MKLAIHTSAYSETDLSEALRLITEAGYENVEIAADISESQHFEAHCATGQEVASLSGLLREYGLNLAALDIGGWDPPLCIANLDEAARKSAVRNTVHAVAVTSDLGCPLITSHLWGLPKAHAHQRVSEFRSAFLRSIDEIAPILESRNVRLNFMPHPGGFIDESDATVDLVREADCPQLGYTYGISHSFVINRPRQTPDEMISYAGKRLTHVLVSDTHDVKRIIAPPEVKAHEHTVPGRGDIDFSAVVRALTEIDYKEYLCVHLISERDRIVDAARETREQVEQWLASTAKPDCPK